MRFLLSIGQRTSKTAGEMLGRRRTAAPHLSEQVEREIAKAIKGAGGYDKDNPFRGGFHRRWVPPKIPPGLELLGYDDEKLKELFQPFIEGQTVGRRQSGKPDEVFDNAIYGYKPGGPRATMTIRREPARVIMDTALWAQGPDGWFSTGRARLEFAAVQGIIVDKWGLTHTGWPSQRLQLACSTEFLSPPEPTRGISRTDPYLAALDGLHDLGDRVRAMVATSAEENAENGIHHIMWRGVGYEGRVQRVQNPREFIVKDEPTFDGWVQPLPPA